MLALIARETRRGFGAGAGLVVAFFLLVAILFPFALGPDARLLARVAGGVIWTAALLAALLPVERLVAPDMASGMIDQCALRGMSGEWVSVAKIVGHWLAFAPAVFLAGAIAAALLGLPQAEIWPVALGLLLGTPGLAALALATAALVAGLRGAGAIAGLVMLPLAVPLLIFGAGASGGDPSALKLLAATSLALVAGAPFVAGAAMRLGQE